MSDNLNGFSAVLEMTSPMYGATKAIWKKVRESEKEKCLMILGSKGSGKTMLWKQLTGKTEEDEFEGAVWLMSPPKDFLRLVDGSLKLIDALKICKDINFVRIYPSELTQFPIKRPTVSVVLKKANLPFDDEESLKKEDIKSDILSLNPLLGILGTDKFLDKKFGEKKINIMPVLDYDGADSMVKQSADDLEEVLGKEDEGSFWDQSFYADVWDTIVNKKKSNDCCILYLVDLLTLEKKKMEVIARLRRISDSVAKVLNDRECIREKLSVILLLTNRKKFRQVNPTDDCREIYQRIIGNAIDPQRINFKIKSVMVVDVSEEKDVERIKEKIFSVLA